MLKRWNAKKRVTIPGVSLSSRQPLAASGKAVARSAGSASRTTVSRSSECYLSNGFMRFSFLGGLQYFFDGFSVGGESAKIGSAFHGWSYHAW